MTNTPNRALSAIRTVAILRHITPDEVIGVAEALASAGIDIVEVTLNTAGALSMIETLAKRNLGNAMVGAGTVTTPEQVASVADAGGRIVISPDCRPAVIAATNNHGLISLPGCMTPSEAFVALEAGADGLKIFPCEMAPPAAVKAIKAILPPHVPVFAVGGISAQNAGDYLAAGAQGLGVGSSLYRSGKPLDAIARDAAALVAAVTASGARQ